MGDSKDAAQVERYSAARPPVESEYCWRPKIAATVPEAINAVTTPTTITPAAVTKPQ